MESPPAIEVVNLTKRFRVSNGWFRHRPVAALREVSFTVTEGMAFGMVGPRGAGKTTLLKILCTVLTPTAGQARIGGHSIQHIHKVNSLIGFAPDGARGFGNNLTARENLEFFAALFQMPRSTIPDRISQVLRIVGVKEPQGTLEEIPGSTYLQRLNMARALLHDPPILLLDEPTRGLDFWSAQSIRHWIRTELIERQKKTVLLTTDQLEDVREVCHEALLLKKGRTVWRGGASEIDPEILLRPVPSLP